MKNINICLLCLLVIFGCKKDPISEPVVPAPPPPVVPYAPNLPKAITDPYTDLTKYSVKVSGSVTDSGQSKVLEVGFVIDTLAIPTVDRNVKKLIATIGQDGKFRLTIAEIPAGKTYYIRSYAKNEPGVGYGNEISFTLTNENVFVGDAKLTSQQEVIAFGAKQYHRITGELEITGNVSDLSPLKNLMQVALGLKINYTDQLTSLKGMDSLESIYLSNRFPGIVISHNTALKSLDGLNKMNINFGAITITNNSELTDISALGNHVFNNIGSLTIIGCPKLLSLKGLEAATTINGHLTIRDNAALENLTPLQNVERITGDLYISNNGSLRNLNGLGKITKLHRFDLTNNSQLTDIDGINNLDSITTWLIIEHNVALRSIAAFSKIKTLNYVTIENCPVLNSLNGLQNLISVAATLQIKKTGIKNLTGFDKLVSIGSMSLVENRNLENLQGLISLTTATRNGFLGVVSNLQLKSLSGIEKLSTATGQAHFFGNPQLTDFCGLKTLAKGNWTNGSIDATANAENPTREQVIANCP